MKLFSCLEKIYKSIIDNLENKKNSKDSNLIHNVKTHYYLICFIYLLEIFS